MNLKCAGGPLAFFSTQEAHNEYDIDAEEQRARIRDSIGTRRRAGDLRMYLHTPPEVFLVARGSGTSKAGWVAGWRGIANVRYWDWGWAQDGYNPYAGEWALQKKPKFNEELFNTARGAHRRKPIDVMVSYLSGRWVYPETMQRIKDLGIIMVNITFDDTLLFWGDVDATGFTGDAGIARVFDIYITAQNRRNVGKYVAIGANPLYMPPGGDNTAEIRALADPPYERPIPASFVGANYGVRGELVELLRKEGVTVVTRGNDWPEGRASLEEMGQIIQSSLVTLGFGFISRTPLVGLKGRDFYTPMIGTVYLTTYCRELSEFFEEGKEILFYRTPGELVAKTKWCLAHPDEARAIGLAGRRRALREYRWENRWKEVLELCR